MKARLFAASLCLSLCALVPAQARAQALTSLSSVRVGYTTRKNTVQPQGELKAQIDALDAQIADATRLGKSGELRRLFAKGLALLNGTPWTDTLDYSRSLVLRTPRVVVDSSKPYTVRLEQIYASTLALQSTLTAHLTLHTRPAPGQPAQAPPLVKDFDTVDGVARDLRESPHFFDVDLHDVADGPYLLNVEIANQGQPIGSSSLQIALRKGVDDLAARLEAAAARAPEALRAEILFPIDRMKNVNRGRLELRTFDPERDLAAAEAVAAAVKAGKDPFAGRTGDIRRHYRLDAANEILPYRTFVPSGYTGARAFPLIIALHGLGGTEDAFFDNYEKKLPPLAESHGYIVAAPLGYRVDGSYGWGLATAPSDPNTKRTQDFSEQDVMQVLARVRQLYRVDDSRIYLMGHSMGAIGTWKIAPKYPDLWAAIGMFSGSGAPAALERIRTVPEIIVHGDADPTVPVGGSRAMIAKLKELGTEFRYIEVPGGLHSDVVAPNMAAIVDFFDAHKKSAKSTTQR